MRASIGRIAVVVGFGLGAFAGGARAADSGSHPNLSGKWQLDPSRSDSPAGGDARRGGGEEGGGMRGRFGGYGGGRRGGWGGGGAGGGAWRGAGGERDSSRGPRGGAMRLPETLRVEDEDGVVKLEDANGLVVQTISASDSAAAAAMPPPAAATAEGPGGEDPILDGVWKGGRLEVDRSGPGGGTFDETLALADKDQTLVVTITFARPNGPSRTVKRTYKRVTT